MARILVWDESALRNNVESEGIKDVLKYLSGNLIHVYGKESTFINGGTGEKNPTFLLLPFGHSSPYNLNIL